jgi:hypothetical protein
MGRHLVEDGHRLLPFRPREIAGELPCDRDDRRRDGSGLRECCTMISVAMPATSSVFRPVFKIASCVGPRGVGGR